MSKSKLDSIYRRLLVNHFFERGWGKPENLKRLFEFRKIISNRQTCYQLVPRDYPVNITKKESFADCTVLEGSFTTPLELHLPGVVPKAVQQAHFQVLLPKKWKDESYKSMCIHLAGTGDHFFWRRRNFIAKPLLKEANIGAILLENPFYGLRKPDDQVRSNLHNVSDIFVMGGCLILECLVLLHWCERHGLGPLGITGLSMGGHMASLAACSWPKPIVLVPCLSWSTASAVFTTGVLSQSIDWDVLETQYNSDGYYRERLSKMVTVVDDAFMAGRNFIKDFNQSLFELKQDIKEASKSRSGAPAVAVGSSDKSLFNGNQVQNRLLTDNTIKPEEVDKAKINTSTPTPTPIDATKTDEVSAAKINTPTPIGAIKTDEVSVAKINTPTPIVAIKTDEVSVAKINTPTPIDTAIVKIQQAKPEEASTLTKLMRKILPKSAPSSQKIEKFDVTKINWWEREALQFMRGMMDECTHLRNFSVPYDTSLIIAVCAKEDAYVPREGCTSLEDIWPGAEIRYLDAGHVSAYVLNQKFFRSCIIEAFERSKAKQNSAGENLESTMTYEQLLQKYTKIASTTAGG